MGNQVDTETEMAIERLFNDAQAPAKENKPTYDGRALSDIEDDIALVRTELDIEL